MPKTHDIFDDMARKWPSAIVSRQEVGRFSGGAVSPKLCANEDCNRTGSHGRFNIGRRVCYPVVDFCNWLRDRSTNKGIDENGKG
jgi:hypothetical protein